MEVQKKKTICELNEYLGLNTLMTSLLNNYTIQDIGEVIYEDSDIDTLNIKSTRSPRSLGEYIHSIAKQRVSEMTTNKEIIKEGKKTAILHMYFGIDNYYAYTPEQIARKFQITPRKVLQIKNNAIRKIKTYQL